LWESISKTLWHCALHVWQMETDKRYLVEFYILHEADVTRYNATNQRYWLQYHAKRNLGTPNSATETHFILPSDTSEQLAACHHLVPSHQWVSLVNECTYIHGPFNFDAINGRESRDLVVSQTCSVKSWEDAVFWVPYFARSRKIRHRAHVLTDVMGGQGRIFELEIG
jgi:hypothetical protein